MLGAAEELGSDGRMTAELTVKARRWALYSVLHSGGIRRQNLGACQFVGVELESCMLGFELGRGGHCSGIDYWMDLRLDGYPGWWRELRQVDRAAVFWSWLSAGLLLRAQTDLGCEDGLSLGLPVGETLGLLLETS
jgi:hypothetical protein